MLAEELHAQLPLRTEVGHKPFALGTNRDGATIIVVRSDLDQDERGPYHQRRLRDVVYRAQRSEPLETSSSTPASAGASARTARARSTRSSCAAARRSSIAG